MNMITSIFSPKPTDPLSEILDELASHGAPRISKLRSGWLASVTIEDGVQGKRVEISSECKHSEASSAAEECRQRLHSFISGSR